MGSTVRLVLLGDLHFSEYPSPELEADRDLVFASFFRQVVALQPDHVFALGDTTHQGSLRELDGLHHLIRSTGIPLMAITGNHDCYYLPKPTLAPYFLGPHEPVHSGGLYSSFDHSGIRFVLLDTARDRDPANYGGIVSPQQLAWLEGLISDFNGDPQLRYFVLLGHHPLYQTTHISHEEMMHIANSREVMALLETLDSTPGLYCNGHNHSHSIARLPHWLCVQTAAPLDCRSGRLVTLSPAGIQVETFDFDLTDPRLSAALERIHTSFGEGFHPQPKADTSGSVEDRVLLMSLG
ncbi:MAG: hypothetical protein HC924_17270 [Synechococcaceae cyanobacterium SM2_3_2]|nr:hypothetical protein [Synechococcaceae cyanobacterium SM2_3_2]